MSKQIKAAQPVTTRAADRATTLDLVACPECGSTAEVLDRFAVGSTSGPVEHVRISCLFGHHHFTMPAPREQLPAPTESRSQS